MKTIKKSVEPFRAKVSFGLIKGYTNELISKQELIKEIRTYQDELIDNKGIYLSVSISESVIVLSGQEEPHLILNFINYPKFLLDPIELKTEIEKLVEKLMILFQQNRVIIEYLDQTLMLEFTKDIDPNIKR